MNAIHVIRKDDPSLPQIRPVKEMGEGIFSSGDWSVSEARANSLIGGRIYFHRTQAKASFFGGTVIKVKSSAVAGRVIFIFEYDPQCRGVITPPEGWSQEKKYDP